MFSKEELKKIIQEEYEQIQADLAEQVPGTNIQQVEKIEGALNKIASWILSNNVQFPKRQEVIRNLEMAVKIVKSAKLGGRSPSGVALGESEADALAERELSSTEKKDKEHYVRSMKTNKDDFQKRYGENAKDVMYATATKLAKDK